MTHNLAYNISLFLCRKDSIQEEDIDIYTYGFEVFIDSILETVLLLIVGMMLGHMFETVLFIGAFGLLRSFTGGYHASSKLLCTFMTISTCVVNVLFSCIMSKYMMVYMILGLVGILVIWKYAPKAHANKPLDYVQKKRNRLLSRMLCVIYVVGILICCNGAVKISNVLAFTLFQVSVLLLGKEWQEHEEVT